MYINSDQDQKDKPSFSIIAIGPWNIGTTKIYVSEISYWTNINPLIGILFLGLTNNIIRQELFEEASLISYTIERLFDNIIFMGSIIVSYILLQA